MMPAIEYSPIFLVHWSAAFLERTRPASNIANPHAMNMTKKPCIKNERVLKINAVSSSTAAQAGVAVSTAVATPIPAAIVTVFSPLMFASKSRSDTLTPSLDSVSG